MTKVDIKSNQMYKCNVFDKPYVIKGALTNHLRKVHNLTISPTKKNFMDISSTHDLDDDDELELDNTIMIEQAEEQDLKEAADELDLIYNMTNTINFNSSVLASNVEEAVNTKEVIKVLSDTSQPMVGGFPSKNQVPLCSPAAKFLTESQKKDPNPGLA